MGVIRFLGQHKGTVALVVVLLALKAVCDLALPVFTDRKSTRLNSSHS